MHKDADSLHGKSRSKRTGDDVVATLLGPDGNVLSVWKDRPPVGFCHPDKDWRE